MSWNPDRNAQPLGRLFTRQLSQRDLSLSIPVNFVEQAGVSLRVACFANNRYIEGSAERCFSNLLAIGFHRYEVDVYWDASRQLWSLCPVELGGGGDEGGEDPSSTSSSTTSSVASSAQETGSSTSASSSQADGGANARDVAPRQATAIDSSLSGSTLPSASVASTSGDPDETDTSSSSAELTSTSASLPSATSSPEAGDYVQAGPYACSESVDLDWLSRIMFTYLDATETNLNATLRYMLLNVHAAASPRDAEDGSAAAPSSDDLPGDGDSLSSVLASNLSSVLYTPADLREERANINDTWYDASSGMTPAAGYYNVNGPSGATSTQDGWPSEDFIEMSEGKRLLVGFGTVDPQMEEYDVSQDDDTIFPLGYLQVFTAVSTGLSGQLNAGCFFPPSGPSMNGANNSWASSVGVVPISATSPNLTGCGISPILNQTLQNTTADQDFLPYQTYLQSTLWSWAPEYPRIDDDSTDAFADDDDTRSGNYPVDPGGRARCAALNASSGFWQNIVCNTPHRSACRRRDSVYDWTVSPAAASYTDAGLSCPDDAAFDVPRTGLQNTHLLDRWRALRADPANLVADEMLWLNFNNLDSEPCWVVGQNTTCPYVGRRGDSRQVVVPVVAAVIVFALGVLTVFVKCAANRRMNQRQRRRRRRVGTDGWEYEGVPS